MREARCFVNADADGVSAVRRWHSHLNTCAASVLLLGMVLI